MEDIIDSVEKALGKCDPDGKYLAGEPVRYINLPGSKKGLDFPFEAEYQRGLLGGPFNVKTGIAAVFPVAKDWVGYSQEGFNDLVALLRLVNELENGLPFEAQHKLIFSFPRVSQASCSSPSYKDSTYHPGKLFLIQEAGQFERCEETTISLNTYPKWLGDNLDGMCGGKYVFKPEPDRVAIYSVACVVLYPDKAIMDAGLTRTDFAAPLEKVPENSRRLTKR